jgi:hypothetical protein
MATGIVSLAMHFEDFPALPEVLLWLNVIFYVVLWGITIVRIARFRSALIGDLIHHARGVTFLTTVAGTSVLGVQFAILTPFMAVAASLWVFSVLLWLILIYTFFAAVTVVEPKPSIGVAINGSWLLVTVATESLTVLGTLVAQRLGPLHPILFGALCAYLPAVRDRGDLPDLLEEVLNEEIRATGIEASLGSGAKKVLEAHAWPGNLREMHHVLRYALSLCESGVILPEHLPDELNGTTVCTSPDATTQRARLEALLEENGWCIESAAKALGVARSTLYRQMDRFHIVPPNRAVNPAAAYRH